MASSWQSFENECYNYLNSKYGSIAKFIALGKSDSKHSDIQVFPVHDLPFFVEIKSSEAQCGQFVLIPDETQHKFIYSEKNPTPFFSTTKMIMDHMDSLFREYVNAGTAGRQISLDKNIFYHWVKDYYTSKNVKFFITKASNYIVFPIEQFDAYFDISCTYRMKRSGSSSPSKSNIREIEDILLKNNIKGQLVTYGKEYYLKTAMNITDLKLKGSRYTYIFRAAENSQYRIRRLSNTCNSNVIFQISLKKLIQDKNDLCAFEQSL